MSTTVGGIRIVDMPDLGAFTSDSSVVGEHAGSGRFSASGLSSYFTSSGQFVPAINPITGVPGILSFPSTDPYQSPDSYALTGSMTVRAQPYGYYDTGALLSLVATTEPLSSSRAGINGGFEAGVAAIAGYGTFDSVNIYSGIGQWPPPLILRSVTYDATHVYPQTPLTTAQMKVLRKNMWVLTNSIDTSIAAPAPGATTTPQERHYGSYVTGWASDGTSITVVGWTVPGSGHTAAGQVPSSTFDPGDSSRIARFGVITNAFGANFVATHYPGAGQESRTTSYQGMEFDFFNFGTVDYDMTAAGLSLNYSPQGGARLTTDSYGIKCTGFPTGLYLGYSTTGINIYNTNKAIVSDPFFANNGGSPAPWAGSPTGNLTFESINYIDTNVMRLQCWTSRDVHTAGGWPDASVRLGVRVDGTPFEMSGGTLMAQLVWNPQGFQGGFAIHSASGLSVLSVGDAGNIAFHGGLKNAANDAAAAAAGVLVDAIYRNGSVLQIRVT